MLALSYLKQQRLLSVVAAVLLIFVAFVGAASAADSPFIEQIPRGIAADLSSSPPQGYGLLSSGPTAGQVLPPRIFPNFTPQPEAWAPKTSHTNLAATIEIGRSNNVIQFQNGIGNESVVGVIGGNANNVFVGQTGNDLRSNLLMIGTNGMNVAVLQPNGSPPVEMAIIRARTGTVIIPR